MDTKPILTNIIQIYAPTSESSDEELDTFYDDLRSATKQCKSQDNIIIQGDFNAKVGEGREGDIVGKYGLGARNENGEKLIQFAKENNLMFANTWFKEHKRRLWTWKSPDGSTKNQIDYVLTRKRFRNSIKRCKSYPGADCNSDHNLILTKYTIKLKKVQTPKVEPKPDISKLRTDSSIRTNFAIEMRNRFQVVEDMDVDTHWGAFKSSINVAVDNTVPKKEKVVKQEWMATEKGARILVLMQKRRKAKSKDLKAYDQLNREIDAKCIEAKEDWLNSKCEEIEKSYHKDSRNAHKNIRELSGKRQGSSTGCIKSKDGVIIMEKEKILERWSEYIGDLYGSDRNEQFDIELDLEGPVILESEVSHAIHKTKRGKAGGPDNIVVEMLEALEEFGTEELTKILNRIYDTGHLPEDLTKSIFIALGMPMTPC